MNEELITTLYCELMTGEQVAEFESLMTQCGYGEMCRPMRYAKRVPVWVLEKREREEGEDPLAAITLTIDHNRKKVRFDAGYRSCSGQMIEPEQMKLLLAIRHYNCAMLIDKESSATS